MEKKKIRLIVIISVIAVVIAVGAFFGVSAYNNYITQQHIEERIKEIDEVYDNFESETDRDAKMKILVDFIKDRPSTSDEVSVEILEAIEPEYNKTLQKMQQYFIDEYNTTLTENTLENLEKVDDKEQIKTAVSNLIFLSKTIENEKNTVFISKSSEYTALTDKAISLVTEYRKYFTDNYNAVIDDNKLKDVDKIQDKNKLSKAIENLNALKKTIDSENDIIFESADGYSDLFDKIDKLISSYQKRIEIIEETEKNQTSNSSSSDSSYSSDNNSSLNYSNNSNNDYSSDYYNNYNYSSDSHNNYNDNNSSNNNSNNSYNGNIYWYEDGETGEKTYRDEYGNHWDDHGNTWTDDDLGGFLD